MTNDPPCQPTLVIRSRLCSTCVVSGSRIAGGRRRQAVIYFKPSRSTRESRFVHLHLRSAFRVYCCDFLRRILDRSSSFFLTHQLNGLFFSEIKKNKSTPGPNFSWKSVDFFFCWKVCVRVCVTLLTLFLLGWWCASAEFERWKKLDIFSSSMGHRHPIKCQAS